MKKFFIIFGCFFFIYTNSTAEYILEPATCTLKNKNDCGAYLYNNKTGATYFCDNETCKEILQPIDNISTTGEGKIDQEVTDTTNSNSTNSNSTNSNSTDSNIPKTEEKKSKIPKFKKSG